MNIGIDIEEIARFAKTPYGKNKKFYQRIFTPQEIKACLSRANSSQCFAARFSAKEAVIKAAGKLNFKDIEITNKADGRPEVKVCRSRSKSKILISISHTKNYAVAVAMTSN